MSVINEFGQPTGEAMVAWCARPRPSLRRIEGRYCTLVPTTLAHARELFAAYGKVPEDWTYVPYGPFDTFAEFEAYIGAMENGKDPLHFTVLDNATGRPGGTLALMRIRPEYGVMEVGHVVFSQRLKKTAMATEAHYLLMKEVFDALGYRRYEWKCDSLNQPSQRAAARLGFVFEGVFRQALIYKGRTRDTAWLSIIDKQWCDVKRALEAWLAPENFSDGQQRQPLARFMPR
ncbi:GNAT family protein [Erwinia sp. HR93]|uniref:GNAT family N-acetyltransferase n=1 Tax=Erwinia sp. HR93 TaxID=3094840 RepID=UPI002ADEC0A5|nr:GNAT family protein [Erwinia sp. HR93]MEA1065482.1 GNAT family protein [Erwinia sp. HR93]